MCKIFFDVFQNYGLVELGNSVAAECKEKNGMHLTENDFFVEIVDPKNNERLEDGEIGELVFTTLSREGMPLIRYKTNDLGFIMPEKCPCGLPFKRIKVKGRLDDIFIVGSGDNLYPKTFDDVILDIPSIINYQIIFILLENGLVFKFKSFR